MYQAVTKEMLPQMGQQKAPVHTASHSQRGSWVGKRIETKDLKEWALQSDFKEMGNCKLNCQQFPAWNVVTEPRAKTYYTNELKLNQGRGVSSGWNCLQLKLTCPRLESLLNQEFYPKKGKQPRGTYQDLQK